MPAPLVHPFPFDPTHGYSADDLLRVGSPEPPDDFEAFWRHRHDVALAVDPRPALSGARVDAAHPGWQVLDIEYRSTGGFHIGGWLMLPRDEPVERGLVVGHGYGGREGPDFGLPVSRTAVLFPCFRGLSRSTRPPISRDPNWHVLHDIDKRDRYILGGCVDDLWIAVSVMLALYPWVAGHVAYCGTSFGGGIGALAIPWDPRIVRGHLEVPTFGNHPLRLTLDATGSSAAVRKFQRRHEDVLDTLRYYDAATAARFITVPMHVAPALFDPAVPPAGQFAIHNAIPGDRKKLFTLDAGHFEYPGQADQELALRRELEDFLAGS
ncbi:deacetylase [Skermanella stibiiresistens SB22]|uniref:Deacetylase n=1 Tax=Skermanella stibiiresistens SB22 TaxID=1385369 RepID=W9GUX0_9PROT|nr:acetylxylan esterase [Skermanella stibiiresistens]EWY36461.1 deacetylase [Skermanella stibiiresistens SB22]